MTATRRRALIGGGAALVAGTARAADAPGRIVSLSACLDVILVNVADRDQIAALSHYARQPQGSTIAQLARALPFTWETAEEVIALRPDLVLTSRHTALATRNALERLKVPTALFGVPDSIEESLAQVRQVADRVGRSGRGLAMTARIRAAIAASAPPAGARPLKALVFQPNGFAAGRGTLMDEMMTRAGFENVAGRYGLAKWGNVQIERLLADPPEVLLSGTPTLGARSWADKVMTHPALTLVSSRMVRAGLDDKLMHCGGPVLIQTAAALKQARLTVLEALA